MLIQHKAVNSRQRSGSRPSSPACSEHLQLVLENFIEIDPDVNWTLAVQVYLVEKRLITRLKRPFPDRGAYKPKSGRV